MHNYYSSTAFALVEGTERMSHFTIGRPLLLVTMKPCPIGVYLWSPPKKGNYHKQRFSTVATFGRFTVDALLNHGIDNWFPILQTGVVVATTTNHHNEMYEGGKESSMTTSLEL